MQYLSRPFVVGDKIDVMTSSGGKVVSGFVEEVSPMRTHLRTDHWMSIMVPNKVREDFCVHHPSASSSHNAKRKQLPTWDIRKLSVQRAAFQVSPNTIGSPFIDWQECRSGSCCAGAV